LQHLALIRAGDDTKTRELRQSAIALTAAMLGEQEAEAEEILQSHTSTRESSMGLVGGLVELAADAVRLRRPKSD
jgi:hypothetical protein